MIQPFVFAIYSGGAHRCVAIYVIDPDRRSTFLELRAIRHAQITRAWWSEVVADPDIQSVRLLRATYTKIV